MSVYQDRWQSEDGAVTLYLGDCLEILPTLEPGSVDAVVTDPPYGVKKAEWDTEFPTEWYQFARGIGETVYTMVGPTTVPKCLAMVGDDYQDVMAIWLSNGMTLGPLGFGNWIPVVVSQKNRRFLGGQNAFRVVVDPRERIDHPSPKPLQAMLKLIENREHESILDPFMGSGTTGVACIRTGRRFIGIEIERKYWEIAVKRCQAELERFPLFEQPQKRQRELMEVCA